MRINLYTQNRHAVIVDGVPITGFAEGDFLDVELDGNEAQRSLGADGPSMNLSTPQGGKISLSIFPTSPALGVLYGIRDVQAISPRMFTISLITGVEEVITASGCAFGKLDSFSTGADKMAARKFNFECLQIKLDTSGVETISGGFIGGLI
jgi:hypothetical protein